MEGLGCSQAYNYYLLINLQRRPVLTAQVGSNPGSALMTVEPLNKVINKLFNFWSFL
jgi:hypothetical protein